MKGLLRRLFRPRRLPGGKPPDYQLGPLSGYYRFDLDPAPWPTTYTFDPVVEVPDKTSETAMPGMTDFPMVMAFYNDTLAKPWRLLIFDPECRMYVTVKSYLTSIEAETAMLAVHNGWSLDCVLRPN